MTRRTTTKRSAKTAARKKKAPQAAASRKASVTAKARPKGGRPPDLTQRVADDICRRLADGESLRGICSSSRMPNSSTVRRWLAKASSPDAPDIYVEFRAQYARAREDQADALADEILDEARSANAKNAHAKRLLVDALKWRAAKLRPKVYGDRVELGHSGPNGGPIPVATTDLSGMSPKEAARQYKALCDGTG